MNNNLYYMCITKRRKQMYNESWKWKEIIMFSNKTLRILNQIRSYHFYFKTNEITMLFTKKKKEITLSFVEPVFFTDPSRRFSRF